MVGHTTPHINIKIVSRRITSRTTCSRVVTAKRGKKKQRAHEPSLRISLRNNEAFVFFPVVLFPRFQRFNNRPSRITWNDTRQFVRDERVLGWCWWISRNTFRWCPRFVIERWPRVQRRAGTSSHIVYTFWISVCRSNTILVSRWKLVVVVHPINGTIKPLGYFIRLERALKPVRVYATGLLNFITALLDALGIFFLFTDFQTSLIRIGPPSLSEPVLFGVCTRRMVSYLIHVKKKKKEEEMFGTLLFPPVGSQNLLNLILFEYLTEGVDRYVFVFGVRYRTTQTSSRKFTRL